MKLSYGLAINEAIKEGMRRDERVFCIGEDVGHDGGSFGITRGIEKEFGDERVINTPISEQFIAGASVGAAMVGMRPLVEIMFSDFMGVCFDALMNQAAKLRYMNAGSIKIPMVVRFANGGGLRAAAQHSQSLEGVLTQFPGLKVVYPSTPQDAYDLLLASLEDDNPVMFFEHKALYEDEFGEVDLKGTGTPLGKAAIRREGSDVTIIATGRYATWEGPKACDALAAEGISAELIDPRTLFPLDKETIYNSVRKTGKVVIVTEECKRGAWSAELMSNICEDLYDDLKAHVVRIGSLNVPFPYTGCLEDCKW